MADSESAEGDADAIIRNVRPQPRKPDKRSHLIAGTTAGVASTGLLYPLDLVKTRYQVYDKGVSPYASLRTAFRTIVLQEGWGGLYQGLGPALLGSGVSWGGYFYLYEMAKDVLKQRVGEGSLGAGHHLAAGMAAGNALVLMTNPIWLIKTRLQLQNRAEAASGGQRLYRGFTDAAVTIVREEGPLALYKGVVPALLLCSQGALQFMAYEWLKARVPKDLQQNSPIESLCMGGSSKIFASLVSCDQRNCSVICCPVACILQSAASKQQA
jgi:solute carrier family 25 (mitochondrial folate transporter), member 32